MERPNRNDFKNLEQYLQALETYLDFIMENKNTSISQIKVGVSEDIQERLHNLNLHKVMDEEEG